MSDETKAKQRRNQSKSSSNVINLGENAPAGNSRENSADDEKPLKLKVSTIEKHVKDWLDGSSLPFAAFEDPFKNNFYLWRPTTGAIQILLHCRETNTVKLVELEQLASAIVEALAELKIKNNPYAVTLKQAQQIALRWKLSTARVLDKWPKPIVFKSSTEMAFARLPYDPSPGEFHKIEKMFFRMTNRNAFYAKIGQILTPNASRKQAVWLYDNNEGDSGKSFILNRIIARICGGFAGSIIYSGDALGEKHWKEGIVGKSLLVANEADPKFLSKGGFKALTGDNWHMINPKNQKQFMGEIFCHVLFSSNKKPQIPNEAPIRKRLIVCRIKPIPENEIIEADALEQMIESELPHFIHHCLEAYKRYAHNGIIPSENDDELDDAIGEFEEDVESIFNQCFELEPMGTITANQFALALESFTSRKIVTLQRMREYLRTEYKIISYQKRIDGRKNRAYDGLILKPFPDSYRFGN